MTDPTSTSRATGELPYKPMPFEKIAGFHTGQAQDYDAMTGVTVIICDQGAEAGVEVSGGGPASREAVLSVRH